MPWAGIAGSKTYGRSNGVYTGTQVWQQDSGAGTKITSPLHDVHDQDVATAINQTLMKDGGNSATADLPMGGNKLTNVGNAAALSQYISGTQAQNGAFAYVPTVGGTANAITLTTGWSMAAYAAGQTFRFIAGSTNSGATTVAVDGLTAKNIKRPDLSALSAGDIVSGAIAYITYDGTQFQLNSAGYTQGGTDVAVADGGTGASTAANARTNLGLAIGSDIQAYSANLATWSGLAPSANAQSFVTAANNAAMRTALGVPYASQANMEAAASSVVVTPDVQHNHPGHPKFWAYVTVSAGTPTLQTSYNVTSITDTGAGLLDVTIATDFSSANWCCSVTNEWNAAEPSGQMAGIANGTVAAGTVRARSMASGASSNATNSDPGSWHVVGFGDQ